MTGMENHNVLQVVAQFFKQNCKSVSADIELDTLIFPFSTDFIQHIDAAAAETLGQLTSDILCAL